MTEHADYTRHLVDAAMTGSERTSYANQKKVGVSDLGGCREYVRRVLLDEPYSSAPSDNNLMAFVGTAVGDHLERQYLKENPDALIQSEVEVKLSSGGYDVTLIGHPDVVDPGKNLVIDYKTRNGLATVRKEPIAKHKFQVTLYAKALIDDGILDEDCTLAVIYVDRSGEDPQPVDHSWTYDPSIFDEAQEWLADVLYAISNGEEASRDMPRSWCSSYCPYAETCRGGSDTDVEGLITDDEQVKAVEVLVAAREAERKARADKKAAQSVLANVQGHTATHTIRWTFVGPAEYTTKREGYQRLDVSKKK